VPAARPPIVALGDALRPRAARVLGCHGNPDRCLAVAGRTMPICARCTGFVAGNFAALGLFAAAGLPSLGMTLAGFACLMPAFADATAQALTSYRSTNPRRLATGALGGFGQIVMLGGFAGYAAPRIAAWVMA
jgi:uncharacterized membrane protein